MPSVLLRAGDRSIALRTRRALPTDCQSQFAGPTIRPSAWGGDLAVHPADDPAIQVAAAPLDTSAGFSAQAGPPNIRPNTHPNAAAALPDDPKFERTPSCDLLILGPHRCR